MAGHIQKRGKNSWGIVLEHGYDDKGKRLREWTTFRGTKKEAKAQLIELEHRATTGIPVLPSKMTTAMFLNRWLSDKCIVTVNRSTYEGYRHIVQNRFIPAFGEVRLPSLTPERIQRHWADWLDSGRIDGKGGLSAATVQRYHQCLHSALDTAVKWGLVGRNVADVVEVPRPKPTSMKALDENDLLRVLQAARDTDYYVAFVTAGYTGMRRSELTGLQWSDVDLDMCQVHVNRSLHQLAGGRFDIRSVKTVYSRRCIDLPPSLALLLRRHKESMAAAYSVVGRDMKDDDLVFSKPDGQPVAPDTLTKAWIRLVRREGFHGVRFHDLRHTHATLLLKMGVHPKIVQERLGHSSIRITLDLYSHVLPGLQKDAAWKFDEWLARYDDNGQLSGITSGPEHKWSLN